MSIINTALSAMSEINQLLIPFLYMHTKPDFMPKGMSLLLIGKLKILQGFPRESKWVGWNSVAVGLSLRWSYNRTSSFHVRYILEISEQEVGSNRLQNKVKTGSNSNNLVHDYSKL